MITAAEFETVGAHKIKNCADMKLEFYEFQFRFHFSYSQSKFDP